MTEPHVEQTRANRRTAGRKAAAAKRKRRERGLPIGALPTDMGPDSPRRGTFQVDGDIRSILARLRAHGVEGA